MATPSERFDALTPDRPADGCWPWGGSTRNGYGIFRLSTKPSIRIVAHRFAYERVHGPIAEGFDVDHLCRNRACVRPDHLEAVSHAVNVARIPRPATCRRGHEREPGTPCKTCNRENFAKWRERHPGEHNARCRRLYAAKKRAP